MAVTADDVVAWITSSSGATVALDADDTALLERVVSAVTAHIERRHTPPDPTSADWELAVLMQAARLWDRRNTPNGIGGEGQFGAVRISRLDPDVAELLAPFRRVVFA